MTRSGTIDPDLLRSFVYIVETGSFTRAAELVARTQSAISMQIRRLEALLGQKLLARTKGGSVQLTAHGSKLLGRAKEMLAVNDAIWASFHGEAGPNEAAPDDYALPIKAQREAFTAQVMMTLLTNDKFTEAYALVMRHAEAKSPIDPARISPKDEDLVMALLSMIEYIAINFLSNRLDREVLLRQRKSGLLKVYEALGDYISYKRGAWGRPNAYRSFEMMVKDFILAESEPEPA